MKKFLPIIINSTVFLIFLFGSLKPVFANAVPFPSPDVPYTEDPEVNFVGKTDARAVQFLNWTLQNYEWACYTDNPAITAPSNAPNVNDPKSTNTRKCDNDKNPLIKFWITIRNIVYAFFALIVLITAFVLMASRGKSLTIKRFLPRFVAVVLLVTLSYSLIQFIYSTVDLIQGFFLTKPSSTPGGPRELINSLDLLYVGWDYEFFRGLRKVHPYFDESVFVNLLLARLTAVTYYAITGVLIIRKIILWFFIVLSPVFPILLLYYPVRNTAKIWIGEFFRWLMYAPLFSIFLSGLVSVWKSPRLPLIFDFTNVGQSFTYPTATNILLGGPGQVVTADNNLNTPDTFALYVVALIMLWVVLLLPFILLQIFLDYMSNFNFEDSPAMQKLINTSYLLLNKTPPPPTTPIPPPTSTGMAKQLPWAKFGAANTIPIIQEGPTGAAKQMPTAIPIGEARQTQTAAPISMAQAQVNTEILNATNISLPTIRDIASYERQIIANRESTNVSKTHDALRQLANPQNIQNEIERDRFTQLKERLVKESQLGNNVASSILSAVTIVNNVSNVSNVSTQSNQQVKNLRKSLTNIANPQKVVAGVDKERMTQLHDSLVKESQQGNTLATTILSTKETATKEELEKIRETLKEEKDKGNLLAQNVLNTAFSSTDTEKTREILQQIANPASVITTSTEKEKEMMTQLHDSLVKESEQGNTLATTILSAKESSSVRELQNIKEQLTRESVRGNNTSTAVLATSFTKEHESVLKNVLTQIANPASVPAVDKERVTQLHDSLVKESEKGNTLATSILSTKESATSNEIHDMKEKLIEATLQGNQSAASILQTAITRIDSTSTQRVMQQLANPSSVTNTVVKERYEKVKDKLVQAQQQGNQFATSMLSKMESVSKEETNLATPVNTKEMEAVKTSLLEAKEKGEPLATEMLSLFTAEGAIPEGVSTPQTNRIQTVSSEDYEAVKKMWQENYSGMDVPEGITSRKAWVADEVTDIDNILSLLTSNDQEKIQEGMQQVGNILPFLMLGGFSNEEIVSYLQAKRDAAKSVITDLATEEETLVTVEKKTTQATTRTQAASIEESEESSMLESVSSPVMKTDINTELLDLTNLPMPTFRDVVKFEVSLLSKDASKHEEVTQVRNILTQIANPSSVTPDSERERVEKIREVLVQNSEQGDQLATSIVSAINHIAISSNMAPIQHVTTNQVLQQIANPQAITNETYKQKMTAIHDKLVAEGEKGNQMALNMLKISDTTPAEEMQKLKEQVLEEKEKQNPLASEVATLLPAEAQTISGVNLPQSNRVQTVSSEDYEAVRGLWAENYKNVEVPAGAKDRAEWIKSDTENIDRMIEMLSSSESEKVQQGMQEVGSLLPFLLLGGFSQEEIVEYLKAKKEAGKTVLAEIASEESEETKVAVEKKSHRSASMTQAATIDESVGGSDLASVTQPVYKENINTDLLNVTSLPMPTMRDVVKFEVSLLSTNASKQEEVTHVREILTQIANPSGIESSDDRSRVENIREMLVQNSRQGDQLASSIVNAINHIAVSSNLTPIQHVTTNQVFQQLANPMALPDGSYKQKMSELHDHLTAESEKGNQFAASLLKVSDITSAEDMQKLKEQVLEGKEKQDPLATEVAGLLPMEEPAVSPVSLPQSNRVQTVSSEDYEAVRGLWAENYKTVDVPQSAKDREEWIKNDTENIDRIIELLSSSESEKVQQGMQEVGNLLPFLLLGGFSQDEIVSYLKAKKEAGESVLQSLRQEKMNEESMVTVEAQAPASEAATQAAAVEIPEATADITSEQTDEARQSESSTKSTSHPIAVNDQLLQLTNLPVPTIKDLVTYEIQSRQNDASVTQLQSILKGIENPESATSEEEKSRVMNMKQTLLTQSDAGDVHAKVILSAAKHVSKEYATDQSNPLSLFHQYLLELVHPEQYPSSQNNEDIKNLHDMLTSEAKKQNILADRILMVTEETPKDQILDLREQIRTESEAGNPLAQKVWEYAPKESVASAQAEGLGAMMLPETNPIQVVDVNDYEAVRSMWEDFYNKSETPSGTANKKEWLQKESDNIRSILTLLSSSEQEKVQEGLTQVSSLLSFVLLGGFSLSEITAYLDAKLHAANSVLQTITESESEEMVPAGGSSETEANVMQMSASSDDKSSGE